MPKSPKSNATKSSSSKSSPANAEIGIIGGSGLYSMAGLTDAREVRIKTPFGDPSDAFVIGRLEGKRVAFLARHGRGHRILPTELNFRANIYAMKLLGVDRIISVSAVGSLQEDLRPGAEAELTMTITAPSQPGDYVLEFDMVHEAVTWFKQRGARPLSINVTVTP